jgi:YgiT-type zinc finger domain-containing protein
MKCVVCHSPDIAEKRVDEEIRIGDNIFLVDVEALSCRNCGESYFDRNAMRRIEEARTRFREQSVPFQEVGKVFRARVA